MSRTEKENPIIRISAEKNFIIAKAVVKVENKSDYKVDVRQGYELYQSTTNSGELSNYSLNEGFVGLLSLVGKKDSIFVKKCDSEYGTLFWLKTMAKIKVPFGFGSDERLRGNGYVTLEINGKESLEKFLKNFPVINWETDYDDGIIYQYVTDYFIDSAYKQNGLSLTLREIIKHILRQNFSSNSNIEEAGEEKIKQKLDDYLKEYGLVANTVSYSSFKKNSGSEGENK